MNKWLRSRVFRFRDERGVTSIEFALVAPVLIITIYAFIEFGWALFTYHQLGHAVDEAMRYAIVHGSDSSSPADATVITNSVKASTEFLDTAEITVTTTWPSGTDPGSPVAIQAVYPYSPLVDFLGIASFDMVAYSESTIVR